MLPICSHRDRIGHDLRGLHSSTRAQASLFTAVILVRVRAGFPSPADDHLERDLDLHELLISHPIFIDSAIVRWTDGCEAGWEITRREEWTHTRLTDFLEQYEREDVASGVLEETHTVTSPPLPKAI